MRIRYTFVALMLAVLLLFVSAGCSNTNNTTEPAVSPTEETVQTDSPLASESAETSVSSGQSEGYKVGDIMPNFSVPLVGGGTFTLSEHRGQPVLINLFATWCPPCVAEMPEIDQLYGEYGDKATFIIIDMGEDEDTAQNFRDTNGYSLPFAHSDSGEPFTFLQYIPDTFVLDADGVIVAFFEGGREYGDFKGALDKALGQ